jgi:ATP-binding cassette, subfamily B, bacterial
MADTSDQKTAEPAKGKNIASLGIVWQMAKHYPGRIFYASIALLVAAAASTSIPMGIKFVVDNSFGACEKEAIGCFDINTAFLGMFGIVIVLGIATAFRFYFVSWLGERVVADIRIAVLNNLLRLSPSYFEENRPAEIASRVTSDTAVIEQIVGTTVSVALRNTLTGIGGIAFLSWLAPALTLKLLVGIPIIVLPITLLGRRLQGLARSSQDRVASVGTVVDEVLGAMKIVQAFGQQTRESERFGAAVESTFSTARKRILTRAMMTSIVITLLFGGVTLLLWGATWDVKGGHMTGGSMIAYVISAGLVVGSFGSLTEVWGDLLRGAGAAGRLAELLAEQPGIAAPANPVALPIPARGAVAFEDVTFHYPTRPDTSALSHFSLSIQPGETVAVVGRSGAGKTTLFQLLQRFYDPEQGKVLIDGVALPNADPAEIRSRMAMVPQETVIFAASARDNLRYGRWDADDDALWAAAEAANAAEFLRKLPEGLDTYMGESGARLSGGQRQRIAIARAILRDSPILLLDEATSALDAESERLVQDALDRLMHNRTTIVIAHRLATVRAANRIIVMDGGQIVEQGSHAELSKTKGIYAGLAKLQFSDGVHG